MVVVFDNKSVQVFDFKTGVSIFEFEFVTTIVNEFTKVRNMINSKSHNSINSRASKKTPIEEMTLERKGSQITDLSIVVHKPLKATRNFTHSKTQNAIKITNFLSTLKESKEFNLKAAK